MPCPSYIKYPPRGAAGFVAMAMLLVGGLLTAPASGNKRSEAEWGPRIVSWTESANPRVPGFWPVGPEDVGQVRLDIWTTQDGLPLKGVERVHQTRDGYLWLATQEGLVRFDGYEFDVFDKGNFDIESNSIYSLYEDGQGALWAGTRNGGVIRYAKGVVENLFADRLEYAKISAMAEDGEGNLLLGLADSTLIRVAPDGTHEPFTMEDGTGITNITALALDDSDALWIGTRHDGLFRYGQGVLTSFLGTGALEHESISDLSIAPDGSIWVASLGDGIARIQGYRVHAYGTEAGLPEGQSVSIMADPNGTVWIGTHENGLWRMSGGVVSQPRGLAAAGNQSVRDIYFDREGSVWMATDDGLARIRNARFKTHGSAEGLPTDMVNTTLEASDGSVWVGTDEGVAVLRNGQVRTDFPEIGEQHVLALAETMDGSIWIGTYGNGLFRYDHGRVTHLTNESGAIPDDLVFALHAGPSGLWMGSREGASRVTTGGYDSITIQDGLGSNDITVIHETVDRDLWLGTYNAGLHLLRNGEVVSQYAPKDFVTAILEDRDGDIWFSVREGGLIWIRDGLLHRFRTEDGMLSDNVLAILEDADGSIWMTSNVGVSRIAKNELDAFAQGRIERLSPEIFTTLDGLRTSEFNGGTQPSGWVGAKGLLFLPSAAGLVTVNPQERNAVPPTVVIERLVSDNYVGPGDGHIVLKPGARRFEIDFTAPNFVTPAKTSYEFLLEGYDREWIQVPPGGLRAAHYTNLSPGTYTFHLRAQNGDGVWSAESSTLTFEITPFYWQTLWFRILCVLAVLAMAWFAYHRRMLFMKARAAELESLVDDRTRDLQVAIERTEVALQQTELARQDEETQREKAEQATAVVEEQAGKLREMDRIKTRFFNNISHEFRTPLTLNIGPMENALMGEYGKMPGPLRRQIEVMLRNSRRLLRLINQLLDLSKLESGRMKLRVMKGSIPSLVEGIVMSFTPFAEKKDLNLTFDQPGQDILSLFDPEGLEKVFFNLLSNSVKFTPDGGTIAVRVGDAKCEIDGATVPAVSVSVRDTGSGIPTEDLDHIFDRFHQVDGTVSQVQEGTGIGLALVKELVELHGGQIQVESTVGTGTKFTVLIPTDADSLGDCEIVSDRFSAEPATRGPMMEMAVLDETDEEDESELYTVEESAPVILVVDDSPDIREYIADCLRKHYNVIVAEDGQEGLELARSENPNMVVSDVMMPRMDGYELCRRMKSDESLAETPFMLVTSKASSQDKIQGLEAGADDYVAKPFSSRELMARVGNLIRVQEQKHALEQLNTDLVASNSALKMASEMKSQLLSIASHDMKNPLTAIREFARVLREESGESHQAELLDLIFDSSNEMLTLISQLLDSTALGAASLQITRVATDLVELAERVVERNVWIADRKGQVVHTTMDDAGSCSIDVDGERVREAMDNLVSNAIKYSPLQTSIYISVQRIDDEVLYTVKDEGPGMTGEDMERAFGQFQKLSARPTGGESSTGLGLSIVKQIVDLHGGRVWAENRSGGGSSFGFALPVAPAGERSPDRPSRGHRADLGSSRSSEGKKPTS
jgi:signal transduction histidine kinase/ligand-binding sensor domain-containing protein